jgi:hypothetical protein
MGSALSQLSSTYSGFVISGLILAGCLAIATGVFTLFGWFTGRWDIIIREIRHREKYERTQEQDREIERMRRQGMDIPKEEEDDYEDEGEGMYDDEDIDYPPPPPPISNDRSADRYNDFISYTKDRYGRAKNYAKRKARQGKRFVQKTFREFSTRGYLWIIIFGVGFFTTLRYFTMIVTPSDLFQVRIGEDLPVLFTRCNEDLVNSGICAMTSSASGYILIFAINALGHAVYMKWSKQTLGIYVIFSAAQWYFNYLFVSYGMYNTYWTFFAFSSLFAVLSFSIKLSSMIDSIINGGSRGDPVPNSKGHDAKRMAIFGGGGYPSYPTEGTITNTVNYGVSTYEFWMNILDTLFGNFGYWSIFLVGTSGLMEITAGTEVALLFTNDFVSLFVLNGLKLYTWSAKSDLEIKAVSGRMNDQSLLPKFNNVSKISIGNPALSKKMQVQRPRGYARAGFH